MTTRCSLVHPSTSKLGPDAQAKGKYEYTPPEVLAYLRNELLAPEDLALVTEFYRERGLPMPGTEPALAGVQEPRRVEAPVAFAHPYGTAEVKRVVRKSGSTEGRVVDAVAILVDGLTEQHAESIFNRLAKRLGYEVG